MRGEDDVVERQEGVVRLGRLRLENVERSTSDAPLLERYGERALVDDRPTRHVDEVGRRLHERDPLGVDEMMRLLGERASDADEVGRRKERLESDELDAAGGGVLCFGVRVGGNHAQVEGLGEQRDLASDVAETDEAECAAGKPQSHMTLRLAPAALASQTVHQRQPVREREDERHRGRGHGSPDAVGGDREHDAPIGAGLDVDPVVADTEPRQERQSLRTGERPGGRSGGEDEDGVEALDVDRPELVHVLGEELPLDPRRLFEEPKPDVSDGDGAVRLTDIPRQTNSKRLRHVPSLRLRGSSADRSLRPRRSLRRPASATAVGRESSRCRRGSRK